jgi:hypothetical protein
MLVVLEEENDSKTTENLSRFVETSLEQIASSSTSAHEKASTILFFGHFLHYLTQQAKARYWEEGGEEGDLFLESGTLFWFSQFLVHAVADVYLNVLEQEKKNKKNKKNKSSMTEEDDEDDGGDEDEDNNNNASSFFHSRLISTEETKSLFFLFEVYLHVIQFSIHTDSLVFFLPEEEEEKQGTRSDNSTSEILLSTLLSSFLSSFLLSLSKNRCLNQKKSILTFILRLGVDILLPEASSKAMEGSSSSGRGRMKKQQYLLLEKELTDQTYILLRQLISSQPYRQQVAPLLKALVKKARRDGRNKLSSMGSSGSKDGSFSSVLQGEIVETSSSSKFYRQFYDPEAAEQDETLKQVLPRIASPSKKRRKTGHGGGQEEEEDVPSSFEDFSVGKLMTFSRKETGDGLSSHGSSNSRRNRKKQQKGDARNQDGIRLKHGDHQDGEVLDLLALNSSSGFDQEVSSFMKGNRRSSQQQQQRGGGSMQENEEEEGHEEEVFFDSSGRLIVKEKKRRPFSMQQESEQQQEEQQGRGRGGRGRDNRNMPFGTVNSSRDHERTEQRFDRQSQREGRWRQKGGRNPQNPQQQRRRQGNKGEEFGRRFKAQGRKTTGGDVMRKGMKFQPYAYLPLGQNVTSRKARNETKGQFKSIFGKRKK